MDGYEVARRLRAADLRARVPADRASPATARSDDRRRAREAGFDHHLVKPVNVQVLAEVIGSRQREPATQ